MDNKVPNRQGPIRNGAEAKYANYFQVGHNAFEFVMEFGQLYPGRQEQVHTSIITSPTYVKELQRILNESIERYEKQFGKVNAADKEP